jgi:hypothetical protein
LLWNIKRPKSKFAVMKLKALLVVLFIGLSAVACQFDPNSHPYEHMDPGQAG